MPITSIPQSISLLGSGSSLVLLLLGLASFRIKPLLSKSSSSQALGALICPYRALDSPSFSTASLKVKPLVLESLLLDVLIRTIILIDLSFLTPSLLLSPLRLLVLLLEQFLYLLSTTSMVATYLLALKVSLI